MPTHVTPKVFSQIIFVALMNEMGATALSLGNWWFNGGKDICINCASEYTSYILTQAVGNSVTPALLFPILSNPIVAYNFIQSPNIIANSPEKVLLMTLMFSSAGLVAKTADAPTNVAIGGLLTALVQFMAANSAPVPFLHLVGNRRGRRLTFKQQVIVGLVILGGGLCVLVTVKVTQKFLIF